MAKFLVTGGAGFIGSNIVEELLRRGEKVRVLDNFSTGREENLKEFEREIEILVGDIRDKSIAEKATEGVDFVLHQAALASVQRSVDDPESSNQVNVQGTLNLLEAARNCPVRRFVFASSSSVYGDSEELPKHEKMPLNPRSPYAVTKLTGEWYCQVYNRIYGLPTVCLRYFNVFGPKQDPNSEYSAVIPVFIKSLLEGMSPTIFGDGEQSRDFTYVGNVVSANLLACRSGARTPRVYNVACGKRFTLNFLYKTLKKIVGSEIEPLFGSPRLGDVRHSMGSIRSVSEELGYEITTDFQEGLKKTVEWYQKVGLAAG